MTWIEKYGGTAITHVPSCAQSEGEREGIWYVMQLKVGGRAYGIWCSLMHKLWHSTAGLFVRCACVYRLVTTYIDVCYSVYRLVTKRQQSFVATS